MDALLSVTDLAGLLQVPVATIYRWRAHNEGPPAVRVGRYLRYSPTAVESWLDGQAVADRQPA